jgi:hypothetical protein
MTPKEKAEELTLKYHNLWINGNSIMAKQCALIAINEIIDSFTIKNYSDANNYEYWKEVKTEIENL